MQCLAKFNFRNHNIFVLLPIYFKFNKMINACVGTQEKSSYLHQYL